MPPDPQPLSMLLTQARDAGNPAAREEAFAELHRLVMIYVRFRSWREKRALN